MNAFDISPKIQSAAQALQAKSRASMIALIQEAGDVSSTHYYADGIWRIEVINGEISLGGYAADHYESVRAVITLSDLTFLDIARLADAAAYKLAEAMTA